MSAEYQRDIHTYERGNRCNFHVVSVGEDGLEYRTNCGVGISDQEIYCQRHAQGIYQTSNVDQHASQGYAISQTHTPQQQYNTSQAQFQQSSQDAQPQQSYGAPNTGETYTPGHGLLSGQSVPSYNRRTRRVYTCARCGLANVPTVLCSDNKCLSICQDLNEDFCLSLGDFHTQPHQYAPTGQCLARRDGPGAFCQEHSTNPVFNPLYTETYYPGRDRGWLFGEVPQGILANFYGSPEFLHRLNTIITREQWLQGERNLFPNQG
ncbi:hypothetical protein OCU04_004998 [Sclerotinia nivalis]|uniref:Uncharacterized protein n=1 Tax=Sclerotinia nivalis TaxID=352851 RepID=A0A9X0DLE4_9HELO|nr:hypothetical protein OCU04_004998 [Sclerotinia nivalis]